MHYYYDNDRRLMVKVKTWGIQNSQANETGGRFDACEVAHGNSNGQWTKAWGGFLCRERERERERGVGGGGEREMGHVMRTKMERVTSHSFTWVATGGG